MSLRAGTLLAFSRLAAALALLLAATLLTAEARAGCAGHARSWSPSALAASERFDLLELAGAIQTPVDSAPPERPKPCSGALCSGSPAVPASATPGFLVEDSSHWALARGFTPAADTGTLRRSPTDPRPAPVDHATVIFHPPRTPIA